MKKRNSLATKQTIKYILIIIVFLFGLMLSRLLWNLDGKTQFIIFIMTGTIILIGWFFDLISKKDVLPILGK